MGGEISSGMNLGVITKAWYDICVRVGRVLSGPAFHDSYGDKEAKELPHVAIPMWSGLDHVIVTKKNDRNDKLPILGTVLQETAISKQQRANGVFPEVDLDATYTLSFSTSNIDVRNWKLSNIPLLGGTDLHSFWGNSSLRIGCWLVPPPSDGIEAGHILETSNGPIHQPKYHLQSKIKYIFSIDIQHISNIDVDNDIESVKMLRLMQTQK